MDWKALEQSVISSAISIGTKVLGALALYIIGRWMIAFVMRLVTRILRGYKLDETIMGYLVSIVNVLLNFVLVLVLLGFFGVETTSFAALLAGAGLAIGTAWGGLLGHFAAGIFMVILRPFKVGDFITAGGSNWHRRRDRPLLHHDSVARQRNQPRGQWQDFRR